MTDYDSPLAAAAPPTGRLRLAQGVVLLFHLTGYLGLVYSDDPAFYLQFTPLTLLLTAGLLAVFQQERNAAFWAFCVQTFAVGFLAEYVGVATNQIFGNYRYGATLGPQWEGVPWLIGLNWVMVAYLAGVLAAYLPWPAALRALAGAVLMVGLDLCIEPVAGRLDMWHWAADVVPLRNFRDWFLVALFLQILFVRLPFAKRNALVPFVYLVQLLFFFFLGGR